jgi:hypothetical protein
VLEKLFEVDDGVMVVIDDFGVDGWLEHWGLLGVDGFVQGEICEDFVMGE